MPIRGYRSAPAPAPYYAPQPQAYRPAYQQPQPVYKQQPAPVYQPNGTYYQQPQPVYRQPAPMYQQPAAAAQPVAATQPAVTQSATTGAPAATAKPATDIYAKYGIPTPEVQGALGTMHGLLAPDKLGGYDGTFNQADVPALTASLAPSYMPSPGAIRAQVPAAIEAKRANGELGRTRIGNNIKANVAQRTVGNDAKYNANAHGIKAQAEATAVQKVNAGVSGQLTKGLSDAGITRGN